MVAPERVCEFESHPAHFERQLGIILLLSLFFFAETLVQTAYYLNGLIDPFLYLVSTGLKQLSNT